MTLNPTRPPRHPNGVLDVSTTPAALQPTAPRSDWWSPEVGAGLLSAVLGVGAVLLFGALGWPGGPYDCAEHGTCFCEAPRAGWIRQPVNTWTNLAPIALALVVGARGAWWKKERARRGQPSRALDLLGLLFPATLAFQGWGSMFFHASLKGWGHAIDALSMFAIAGLLAGTNLLRLGLVTPQKLIGGWIGVMALGLLVGLSSSDAVSALVFALFLTILGTEVRAASRGLTVDSRFFRLGLGFHVTGIAVWFLSLVEGQPLCAPDSWLQGHGLWHLTAGLAIAGFTEHAQRNVDQARRG